jgi:hypothetical protein
MVPVMREWGTARQPGIPTARGSVALREAPVDGAANGELGIYAPRACGFTSNGVGAPRCARRPAPERRPRRAEACARRRKRRLLGRAPGIRGASVQPTDTIACGSQPRPAASRCRRLRCGSNFGAADERHGDSCRAGQGPGNRARSGTAAQHTARCLNGKETNPQNSPRNPSGSRTPRTNREVGPRNPSGSSPQRERTR